MHPRNIVGYGLVAAVALILPTIAAVELRAQSPLPVIHATSRVVEVIDGDYIRKSVWNILPDRKLDVYYVSMPRSTHRVTFRTDRDSIGFESHYGESHDFIIVLNGKDSCLTRILALEHDVLRHTGVRASATQGSDTIPFTVGSNDRIYVAASINGSAPLRFQFDLGAGASIISEGAVGKAPLTLDGKTNLTNSRGSREVPTSSRNTLVAGAVTWTKNITFVVGNNLDDDEDGLLGNSLFVDDVLEIDYERRVLIVHDSLPSIPPGYVRRSMYLDGVCPYFQASVMFASDTITGWYLFDTGYAGLIRINKRFADKHRLGERARRAFNPFNTTYIVPRFRVADHDFTDLKAVVHEMRDGEHVAGLIGNTLLKRFNIILDNRNGAIYLKDNSLMAASFD